jgi:hypothetical protein
MASTEPIAAQELAGCYLDHVRSGLIVGSEEARDLLGQINRGDLLICWSDPWLAFRASGMDGCARLALLVAALRTEADRDDREGLHISARDCHWLIAKLNGGALQIATRARVDSAREAQAAQRRALDLERRQREAEARVGFA